MKVALVVPTYLYKYRYPAPLSITDFPTGFAYLASALSKAGHEVIGVNLNNRFSYSHAVAMLVELNRELSEHKPDVVALGGLCTDYTFLAHAIKLIRTNTRHIPIVLGGNIVTNDAETVTNLLQPDYSVMGEAEESLVNLLAVGHHHLERITQCSKPPDVDSLPLPDYKPFDVETMISQPSRYLYRYTRLKPRPFVLVSARGCLFSCTYCIHDSRKNYRARNIENIMDEIKVTYEKYEYNILVILDELFAVNKGRLRAFCERLIEAKGKYHWDFDWIFQTHPNANLDVETLRLAKEAGCYCFSYGLESASTTVLKSMRKHSKPAQIVQAIGIAREAEVGFSGNLIFGDIVETPKTIGESLRFLLEHGRDCHIFLGNVQPYPGSYLYSRLPQHDSGAYYETIDERPFNLTKIPNRLWVAWIYIVLFLSTKCSWAKSAKSLSVIRTADGVVMSLICPHCHRSIIIFEPTSLPLKERKHVSFLSLFGKFLLSFYHPLYWLLLPLVSFRHFIVSGCPSCNLRIRVRM